MRAPQERLAKIEEWARGHERRCEERLEAIHCAIGEVKGSLSWQRNALWAVVAALLAWALAQLWSANQSRLARLEAPAAPAAAQARHL
jgi:hypothetical protein